MTLFQRVLLLLVVISAGFTVWNVWSQFQDNRSPFRYVLPQEVLTADPIRPGQSFERTAIKCNRTDKPFSFQRQASFYYQVDGQGILLENEGGQIVALAAHECVTRTFTSVLPELGPGRWRLQSHDCIVPEGKPCQSWYTETFTVVAP